MQKSSRVLITNVLGNNQIATKIILFFPTLRHWKQLEKCSADDSLCHPQYAQKCILSTYLNYDSSASCQHT